METVKERATWNSISRDFPGGPEVKTPRFHCRGAGGKCWIPGWGTKIPGASRGQKKENEST